MHTVANGTTVDCPPPRIWSPYAARVRDRGPGLVAEEPHAARDETSTAEAAQTHVSNRNRVNNRASFGSVFRLHTGYR